MNPMNRRQAVKTALGAAMLPVRNEFP